MSSIFMTARVVSSKSLARLNRASTLQVSNSIMVSLIDYISRAHVEHIFGELGKILKIQGIHIWRNDELCLREFRIYVIVLQKVKNECQKYILTLKPRFHYRGQGIREYSKNQNLLELA